MAGEFVATFDAGRVQRTYEEKVARGVAHAAQHLAGELKKVLSVKWPPPSAPFNPPHLRTGRLRAGQHAERLTADGLEYKVGVGQTVPYAIMLERGTGKMAPRPYLMATMLKERDRMMDIIRSRASG